MSKSIEHLKENKMLYTILAALGVGGGTATFTDNLPVTAGEYEDHIAQYETHAEELEDIKGSVDTLLLNQLRASLRQAYTDRCAATDPQAITYINAEIEDLQEQYVEITGRRFEPPPCTNA